MTNILKATFPSKKPKAKLFRFVFLVLLLTAFMANSKKVGATLYFQKLGRVTIDELADIVDLVTTQDGRYYLVAIGGKNSSIQVYQQIEEQRKKPLKIELISTIGRDYQNRKLTELSALLAVEGKRVYAISENYQNNSHGCLVSSYDIESDGTLTPQDALFITSSNRPPLQKFITGTKDTLFLTCDAILVSVVVGHANGRFIKEGTQPIPNAATFPVALIYFESLKVIFVIFSLSDQAYTHKFGYAYSYQNGVFYYRGSVPTDNVPTMGGFSTLSDSLSPKRLLVYLYEQKANVGLVFTFNAEKMGLSQPKPKSLQSLKLVDLKISRNGQRLFYSTEKNQAVDDNRLGALIINPDGSIEPPTDSDSITGNYHKLALTNDSCQLLAMSKTDNTNRNASLILYRINDSAMGCSPTKDYTFIEIVGSITAGLLFSAVTSSIVTSCLCYWLKKQGAKKGYIPVGEAEY